MASLAKARALVELGRHTEARTELTGYLGTEPDSVVALCLMAICELKLGDPTSALRAADGALAADPEFEWALRLRALALSAKGRHQEAAAAAAAAVRVDADEWANHYVLAQVLLPVRNSRKAAYQAAERAVELAPHEPAAHIVLGMAAGGLRRRRAERAAYEEALRLDPESSVALNNLAAMDIESARLGRAARNVTAGLRLKPGEETLQRNLDAVAVRLMVRLLYVAMLTGFLPLVVIAANEDHAWSARAAAGVVQLGTYTLVAWLTLRHLPAGARRHLRGLPGRMTRRQRFVGVALVVFMLALMVAAFAPGELWAAGAGVMVLVIEIFVVLFVVWMIQTVVARFRRS